MNSQFNGRIQSVFNLQGIKQSTLDYHTYNFFKQTVAIVDPTVLSQTLKDVFSNQLSDDNYLSVFQMLCDQMSIYYEQYEKCKYSIYREQRQYSQTHRNYTQKMESLSRQSEQLEEQWKLNYYVVKKAICNDLKYRLKTNMTLQQNLLSRLAFLITNEMNIALRLPTTPLSSQQGSAASSDGSESLDPPQKKKKTSNDVYETNNISTRYILEKLEIHSLCQLYLEIIRYICKPSVKTTLYKFIPISIPDGSLDNSTIHTFLPLLPTLEKNNGVLLNFINRLETDFLYVTMALDNPFIMMAVTCSSILSKLQNSLPSISNSSDNLFNTQVFSSLSNSLSAKREILVMSNMCNKFPEMPKAVILPLITDLLMGNYSDWSQRHLLSTSFILYMFHECDGVLRTCALDIIEILKSNRQLLNRLYTVLPFKNPDRHGMGILLNIFGKHLHQLRDVSFEFLVLLKDITEDNSLAEAVRAKAYTLLNSTVSILQEDFIVYSSALRELEYSADPLHPTSPTVYRLNSLIFLNNLFSHIEDMVSFTIKEDNINESTWYFILELVGITGGETVAMNTLLYLLRSFSFNKMVDEVDGKATLLFLKLYDTYTRNYPAFDELFMEKLLWNIVNSTDQERSCLMIKNICFWVNFLKDKNDKDTHYKPIIFHFIICKWQILFPYLFRTGPRSEDLPLVILEMFISIIKSKPKTLDIHSVSEETSIISIPEMVANQFSQALVAFYFFLLKPTFATKHQRRHQMRHKFKSSHSHDIIPLIILEPDTDLGSTLYYYYYLLIVLAGRSDIIEKSRNIIKEIISILCVRFEKVACSTFDLTLDLIFCNHMESRLHATNVFTSNQVHEQINYPLLFHKDTLSIINYFFPEETSAYSKLLSNDDIKQEDRSKIVKTLFKNLEESKVEIGVSTETIHTTHSTPTSLVNQLVQNTTPISKDIKKNILDENISIRTKGVVFVNPTNVKLKMQRGSHTKKDTTHHDKHNEEIVKLNKSHVLSLFSKCLFSNTTKTKKSSITQQIGKQLMKRLKLQYPCQTYTQLCESLPKKPMSEREIVIDKMFHKFPIMYSLLDFISLAYPRKFIDIENMEMTLKSLFVNVIGEWNLRVLSNNRGFGSTESDKHLIMKTIQILNVLSRADLVIEPMNLITEIIPHVSPKEVVDMLMDVFHCMHHLKGSTPPTVTATTTTGTTPPTTENITTSGGATPNPVVTVITTTPASQATNEEFDVEPYLTSIKDALRNHLDKFAPIYARFTTPISQTNKAVLKL